VKKDYTQTPVPGKQMGGSSASGEALKQRDTRLLGKLTRAQVQLGNAWEDVVYLSSVQQQLFGKQLPPPLTILNTRWKSAEIRNDADILAAAEQLQAWGFEREALRTLSQSTLASYTDADIDRMMTEKNADSANRLSQIINSQPTFNNFNPPAVQPMTQNLLAG
jgi:hypothetical protein